MGAIASQITSLTIVYSAAYSSADQRKLQSSASLAFVRGIHRGPGNSPHKWQVTRKNIFLTLTLILLLFNKMCLFCAVTYHYLITEVLLLCRHFRHWQHRKLSFFSQKKCLVNSFYLSRQNCCKTCLIGMTICIFLKIIIGTFFQQIPKLLETNKLNWACYRFPPTSG